MSNVFNFSEEVYVRNGREIEGLDGWLWVKGDGLVGSDGGAWLGPREDWEEHHSHKFFYHVKNYDLVIQAGGNLGMYPRFLSNRFNMVYTFEPDPLNFHCLVNNNQVNNVVKINAALGKTNGFVDIFRYNRSNVGMHRVEENPIGLYPMLSIDSMNFHTCDMIMLDTEGYEENIIEGAFETIKKFKPVITSENEKIVDMIKEYGYRVVDKSSRDLVLICE
jgi:FkbM family methyltransferase